MIDTHFTNIQTEIIKLLNSAQQSISAAMAWLTDFEIIDTLGESAKKVLILN